VEKLTGQVVYSIKIYPVGSATGFRFCFSKESVNLLRHLIVSDVFALTVSMQLIQILLPLYNKEQKVFPTEIFSDIRQELTEKFGGITTYSRTPATGLWKENEEKTVKDEIIIYEVMTEQVEPDWWRQYKQALEKIFQQDEIIIRAWPIHTVL
jgi:hypothetical protein